MDTETVTRKLFTVEEFIQLGEAGILPEERRFELIRGEIFEMPIPGSPHVGAVNRLNMLFAVRFGHSVIVSVQNGMFLNQLSLPLPDVVLLKPRPDFYSKSLPRPEDVLLIIEVSHTTHWYDTKIKAPLYAEAGIAEYWIVNVPKDILEVRTDPVEGEYRNFAQYRHGQSIQLRKRPEVTFTIDEVLGESPTNAA